MTQSRFRGSKVTVRRPCWYLRARTETPSSPESHEAQGENLVTSMDAHRQPLNYER
jgi:hypothetical protein